MGDDTATHIRVEGEVSVELNAVTEHKLNIAAERIQIPVFLPTYKGHRN